MNRRAHPRPWHADWHVLQRQAAALREAMADPALALAGARVLDLGCGDRPYEAWFRTAGARYEGADIDGAHEHRIDAGRVGAPDAAFDVVASFQVLEHVPDVAAYLREARRLLRDDGRLLLSTHGAWLYHPHPTDFRRWTRDGLRLDVEAAGFRLERMIAIVGPLAWTTVFRLLGYSVFLKRLPAAGAPLAALVALAMNLRARLEDAVTPRRIIEDNACVYLGIFRRAAGAR